MRDERAVDAVRSMRCAGYRVECYTRRFGADYARKPSMSARMCASSP